MIPAFDVPDAILSLFNAREFHANLCGNVVILVERFPLNVHVIFVDRGEVQQRNQVAAFWEFHLIAAAEVGQDQLVFGIVANAFQNVVKVNHQSGNAQFFGPKCGRRSSRPATDDQNVQDLGQIDGLFGD